MTNKQNSTCKIALCGNPNVGKSTIFNALTGAHRHTGNWTGKTVDNACGGFCHCGTRYIAVDLPGIYSLFSDSPDEDAACEFLRGNDYDVAVVIADATALERNLSLILQIKEASKNVIVCVNLLDEAKRGGISADLEGLSRLLDLPVVGTTAARRRGAQQLLDTLNQKSYINRNNTLTLYPLAIEKALDILSITVPRRADALKILCGDEFYINLYRPDPAVLSRASGILSAAGYDDSDTVLAAVSRTLANRAAQIAAATVTSTYLPDYRADKILTSRLWGIPIMLAFLTLVLWLTLSGANYISDALMHLTEIGKSALNHAFVFLRAPEPLRGIVIDGVYLTLGWVISVMLPPMAIFFPLFSFLEDLGYLPRAAFNLDRAFRKSGACGKQALTMCMGLGCNACGVVGARIISSPRERLLAILTNVFVPCNGRFPLLISLATVFLARGTAIATGLVAALIIAGLIGLGFGTTLLVSRLLSVSLLRGEASEFSLEMPPFRRPVLSKILRGALSRIGEISRRAILVAAPAGAIIWLLSNTTITGGITPAQAAASALNPIARVFGMDGVILLAFFLALPASEIVLPIIAAAYTAAGSLIEPSSLDALYALLIENGWTTLTALCVMLFCLLHFPCATTLLTVYKETKSLKWTVCAFLIPLVIALVICAATNGIGILIMRC